jgi:hypothetical protein
LSQGNAYKIRRLILFGVVLFDYPQYRQHTKNKTQFDSTRKHNEK